MKLVSFFWESGLRHSCSGLHSFTFSRSYYSQSKGNEGTRKYTVVTVTRAEPNQTTNLGLCNGEQLQVTQRHLFSFERPQWGAA